ncbi:MAG: DUF4185 domain-containing protein [candidate division KSB1 bacterium]|jgi:hypothetical protein|nr:DUF4185 domain-containing protein [candidate division KSB1 bacterium]
MNQLHVSPIPELERPFRTGLNGWMGSDCAFSLPLKNDRVLWLFGDTIVKGEAFSDSRKDTQIINNSIGIQHGNLITGKSPLRFYWDQSGGDHRSFFKDDACSGFIWPFTATLLWNRLYVFTLRMIQPDIAKVFGFRQIGTEIYLISNPEETPDQWIVRRYELPWRRGLGTFGTYVTRFDKHLYIYGFRKDGISWFRNLKFIVARVDISEEKNIINTNSWEYLSSPAGKWSQEIRDAIGVFDNSTTEFSIHYSQALQKYVLISHHGKSGQYLSIRLSETPYGPFSDPETIFEFPDPHWSSDYFCYAAKAHPELAENDNEIIVTYMTNSKNLSDLYKDLRVYYPRFLKIQF